MFLWPYVFSVMLIPSEWSISIFFVNISTPYLSHSHENVCLQSCGVCVFVMARRSRSFTSSLRNSISFRYSLPE